MNQLMPKVFVEQPLALPGSANDRLIFSSPIFMDPSNISVFLYFSSDNSSIHLPPQNWGSDRVMCQLWLPLDPAFDRLVKN